MCGAFLDSFCKLALHMLLGYGYEQVRLGILTHHRSLPWSLGASVG